MLSNIDIGDPSYEQLEWIERARDLIDKAIELELSDPSFDYIQGKIFFLLNNYTEAIPYLEKVSYIIVVLTNSGQWTSCYNTKLSKYQKQT